MYDADRDRLVQLDWTITDSVSLELLFKSELYVGRLFIPKKVVRLPPK